MNTNTDNTMQNTQLDGMYRMASKFLGYTGPKTKEALEQFRASSPAVAAKMKRYSNAMAKGGLMRKGYAEGGTIDASTQPVGSPKSVNPTTTDLAKAQQDIVMKTMAPTTPTVAQIQEEAGQLVSGTAGQVTGATPAATAALTPPVALAMPAMPTPAAQVTPTLAEPQVAATLAGVDAAKGQLSSDAQVAAASQNTTSVSGVQEAQGTAILMNNPVQRQIEAGELISGEADAATAAAFTEQVQAAQATPTKKATIAGQLEGLMQQFDNGQTPAWAAGAMRSATQMLASRGLGASSLAGQAVIQAAMEAALPIAQIDAQTQASFEAQNLSNRQQRAMAAAAQRAQFIGQEFDQAFQARVANSARIGDIANMNFTAEQQVALENSRAANTVNLANLNNRQAKVMAEAAALAQLDISNLNNRQQAAVQNAQNFLQMDMANLSNEQQTRLFKSQQNIQALFTDQAAQNAAAQFNASSENQTNQFFANLMAQTDQFNASQINAMDQFNADQLNTIRTFNAELTQQRELFNAQNSLVVQQANATWRQNLATLNNAAQNEANMALAQTLNAITMNNIEQIWQRERDLMSYSVQTANNNADRATEIALQKLRNEADASTAAASKSSAFATAAGGIISKIISL